MGLVVCLAAQFLPCLGTPATQRRLDAVVVDSHRVQVAVVSSNNGTVSLAEDMHVSVPPHLVPAVNSTMSGVPFDRALMFTRRVRLSAKQCNEHLLQLRRGASLGDSGVKDVRLSVYDLPSMPPSPSDDRSRSSRTRGTTSSSSSKSTAPTLSPARKRRSRVVAVVDADAACVALVVFAVGFRASELAGLAGGSVRDGQQPPHRMHIGLSYTLQSGGTVKHAAHFVWPSEDTTLDVAVEPLQLATLSSVRFGGPPHAAGAGGYGPTCAVNTSVGVLERMVALCTGECCALRRRV